MIAPNEVAGFVPSSDPAADVPRCNAIWAEYTTYALQLRESRPSNSWHDQFRQKLLIGNRLSEKSTAELQRVLMHTSEIPMNLTDIHPQCLKNSMQPHIYERVNQNHIFFDIRSRELWAIWNALEEIEAEVALALNSPWRMLGVKGWKTPVDNEVGMSGWHLDGCARGTLKLMIYLTPMGQGNGGLELQYAPGEITSIMGEAGTWILFQNSEILHRGVGPKPGFPPRVVVEVTLGPSAIQQTRPFVAGYGQRHPKEPWTQLESHLYHRRPVSSTISHTSSINQVSTIKHVDGLNSYV
jgi:hypothetical protein